MSIKKQSEVELAAQVVRWLQEGRWDVYQEVQVCSGGPIADIVARRHGILWVIETKRTFSLSVIAQADVWRCYAHMSSVAVPVAKFSHGRDMAERVCASLGIGVLVVNWGQDDWHKPVIEQVPPRINRRVAGQLGDVLQEAHRDYAAAGNAEGKRWSPFARTCDLARECVKQRPGITLSELVRSVDHHYSTDSCARGALASWIRDGVVKGLKIVGRRPLRVYQTTEGGDE